MSIQSEAVAALRAGGWSMAEIGRHIGRDSSMISQIASGKRGPNYGRSLAGELHALVSPARIASARGDKHPAPGSLHTPVKAVRRKDSRGHVARTRQKMTRDHDLWGVSNVKKQATKSGARSLGPQARQAASKGRRGGLTITCDGDVHYLRSGGRAPNDPDEVELVAEIPDLGAFNDLIDSHGGDVTAAICEFLSMNGNVETIDPGQVRGIEFRTWTD